MKTLYYIGLNNHEKVIAYCCKAFDGRVDRKKMIEAGSRSLDYWSCGLPGSFT